MRPNEQYSSNSSDEINLVNLAATFLRHRRIFYGVFAGVVGVALLYVLMVAGDVREYSTLVQLGEYEDELLESPEAVIASIESHWYPKLLTEYLAAEEEKLPFRVSVGSPKNTSLIQLTSKTSPELAGLVKASHQKLVDSVNDRQNKLLDRKKLMLEQQVESLRKDLEELHEAETTGEAQAQVIQQRVHIRSEIALLSAKINQLEPAETLVVARESLEKKGTSKKLVIGTAIILALILGVLATFMVEFGVRVRQAMKEDVSEK